MNEKTFKRSKLAEWCIVLVFVGFLAYLPSFFGGFIWDDEDFVYANTYVKELRIEKLFTQNAIAGRGKLSNYYRPIQESLYAGVHAVFGFAPVAYHAVNIIFHILATITAFIFLMMVTGALLPSFFTAIIFLIHPIQTESVSYISGLSDSLYVFFGFLSLIFLIRRLPGRKWYAFSIFFFLLSLLSKETGLVFLPILVGALLFLDKRFMVKKLIPYCFLTVVYVVLHFKFMNELNMALVWGNSAYAHSMFVRLLTFSGTQLLSYSLFVFPKSLFMEHDYSIVIINNIVSWQVILFILINIAILLLLYRSYKKNKVFRLHMFFFTSYYFALFPYMGFVLINGIYYEHFLYLPILFFFALILYVPLKNYRVIYIGVLISFCVGLIVRSYIRQFEWIDAVRFYRQTLSHAQKSIQIRNGLAMELVSRGQTQEGVNEYIKAIEIDPTIPNLYHNLANVYLERGDTKTATQYYRRAIAVDPTFYYSYVELLQIYKNTNDMVNYKEILTKYQTVSVR